MRQAQTVFDRVSRDLADADEQHARAQAELARGAARRCEELRAEQSRLKARQQALQDDPAARSARELRRAAEDAERAGRRNVRRRTSAVERAGAAASPQLGERLAEAESEDDGRRRPTSRPSRARPPTTPTVRASQPRWRRRSPMPIPPSCAGATETLTARQQTAIDRVRTLLARWEQARDALAAGAGEHRAARQRARRDDHAAR